MTQEEVFQQYQVKKKRMTLAAWILIPGTLGLFAFLIVSLKNERALLGVILLLVWIIPWVIITNMIWSCPACKTLLRKVWRPNFCPWCGVPLERGAERMKLPQPGNQH